jgi:hypothetical protein
VGDGYIRGYEDPKIFLSDHVLVPNAWQKADVLQSSIFFRISDIIFPCSARERLKHMTLGAIVRFELCRQDRDRMVLATNIQLTKLIHREKDLLPAQASILLKCAAAKEVLSNE